MAINTSLTDKKVAFLSGTSTKLAEFLTQSHANYGKAVEGTFYLTTDTHQLYIGQKEAGSDNVLPVLVNSGVVTVESVQDLDPVTGSLCFVSEGNMLVRYTGSAWEQINPNTYYRTSAVSLSKSVDASNNTITLTSSVTDKNQGNVDQTAVTGSVTLTASDITSIIDTAVSPQVTTESDKIYLSNTGNGAGTGKVEIASGGGINIAQSSGKLTLTVPAAAEYSLAATDASNLVELKAGSLTKEGFSINPGTNEPITVSAATANDVTAFTIGHAAVNGTGTVGATTGTATQINPSSGKAVVTGITVNSKGHVESIETTTITSRDENTTYAVTGASANNQGKLSVTLTANGVNETTFTETSGSIYYKVGNTTVPNQADLKNYFYTETEIDAKLTGLNALVYKGTVGQSDGSTVSGAAGSLPNTNVRVGDTYLVVGTDGVTYATGKTAKAGDLLIAQGTEDDTGVITSGLKWDYVPSGDEKDTTYSMSVSGNVLSLTPSTGAAQTVTFAGDGTYITANTSGSTVTFSHATLQSAISEGVTTPTTSLAFGSKVKLIDKIVTDGAGHITSARLTEYTLPSDPTKTYALSSPANQTYIRLTDGTAEDIVNINGTSGRIAVTGTTADNINIDLATITGMSASSYGPSSNASPSHGGTFTVPYITTDAYGRITAIANKTITLPDDSDYHYHLGGATKTADNSKAIVNVSSGVATITDNLWQTNGSEASSSIFKIKSDTLDMSVGTGDNVNQLILDVKWGSF